MLHSKRTDVTLDGPGLAAECPRAPTLMFGGSMSLIPGLFFLTTDLAKSRLE